MGPGSRGALVWRSPEARASDDGRPPLADAGGVAACSPLGLRGRPGGLRAPRRLLQYRVRAGTGRRDIGRQIKHLPRHAWVSSLLSAWGMSLLETIDVHLLYAASWVRITKSAAVRVSGCAGRSVMTRTMPGCMRCFTASSTRGSAPSLLMTLSSDSERSEADWE